MLGFSARLGYIDLPISDHVYPTPAARAASSSSSRSFIALLL